jgi:NDP-sugar pyrophosphorylase family protein
MKKVDVILLAGGRATRFQEVTQDKIAKPLYLLNHAELIKYTLYSLDFSLVNNLIFALDHHAEDIRSWVMRQQLPCKVYFSYQQSPGILGAVRGALPYVTTESYVVCNTDEIRDGFAFTDLLNLHESDSNSLATMAATVTNNLYRHRTLNIDKDGTIIETDLRNMYYQDYENVSGDVFIGLVAYRKAAVELFDSAYGDEWCALITPLVTGRSMKAFIAPDVGYFNVGTPIELEEASAYTQSSFKSSLALA